MATKIAWTDETWNPVTGCTKVSPGCANCYAERMAKRLASNAGVYCHYKYENFQVATWEDRLYIPVHWKKPRRVFVCSMGDLFHKKVPWSFIKRVFETMEQTPQHIYQVLTKRAASMAEWCRHHPSPMENVWMGITAENQECLDNRLLHLVQARTVSPVLFLSLEPLLGPINLGLFGTLPKDATGGRYLQGYNVIQWVIVGCESGPGRRPMKLEWAIDIVNQCLDAQVPVFVKQIEIDGKVSHNPEEWPVGLRWQQFPDGD